MGRPERPLDATSDPRQQFALQLRRLREQSGRPTYRAMATVAGYSAPTLSRAAAGDRFPSLETTLAFVRACAGDEAEWRLAWQQAKAECTLREPEPVLEPPPVLNQDDGPAPDSARRDPAGLRRILRTLAGAGGRTARAAVVGLTLAGMLLASLIAAWIVTQRPPAAIGAPVASDAGLNPRDGADPYLSRCGADQVRIEQRTWPIFRPDGRLYGQLALYHSDACRASWGYVYGPNASAWTVVITDSRQGTDPASAPISFRGPAPPDSWGTLMSDRTGCVHAAAQIVTADGHHGPTAMTSCWKESGPVYRNPAESHPVPAPLSGRHLEP